MQRVLCIRALTAPYQNNRLHLVHANITTPDGASTIAYAYDHDGIRVGKTINGTDVFKYVVDKNRPYAQVLEEQRTQGALSAVTNYVYGDDLLSQTTDGVTHYYQYDGLGSTRALSNASGTLTDTYQYDAYGMLLNSTGASVNPYLYRGEQYDPALSAYYLRARYYQPGIGRFLTTDPIEGIPNKPISLHRYLYGNDNPINYTDPTGTMSFGNALITTAIVNVLAGIAVHQNFLGLQDYYVSFARTTLPDAYLLGLSINISMELRKGYNTILELLDILNSYLPIPFPPILPYISVTDRDIEAYEILFSISSGEIALFKIKGMNLVRLPIIGDPLYLGGSFYEGIVFNLWNAENYSGPFLAGGIGTKSLFFSPKDVFMGPWGIGRDIYSKGAIPWTKNYSGMRTYYTLVGKPKTEESEFAIALALMPLTVIPLPRLSVPGSFFARYTIWAQTALAKHYWNKKDKHPVKRRQTEPRPPEFQSGPGLVFLSHYF